MRLGYRNPLQSRFDADFFREIPSKPGIYFMLGEDGKILYIGKAKRLRDRLRNYRCARPGAAPWNVLELVEEIREIKWTEHRSDAEARAREKELLHAVRPPYNIADTEEREYLFIGLRPAQDRLRLEFQLSDDASIAEEGYELFGCYSHRRWTKQGYTALFRLLYAALNEKPRFSYPAKIARDYPPWLYACAVPEEWVRDLKRFLRGDSVAFLRKVVIRLLENETVPGFMRPSLQEDIECARKFYALGPRRTRALRKSAGAGRKPLSHRQLDQAIVDSLEIPQ